MSGKTCVFIIIYIYIYMIGNQGFYIGFDRFIRHEMPQLHLMKGEIIKKAGLEFGMLSIWGLYIYISVCVCVVTLVEPGKTTIG